MSDAYGDSNSVVIIVILPVTCLVQDIKNSAKNPNQSLLSLSVIIILEETLKHL